MLRLFEGAGVVGIHAERIKSSNCQENVRVIATWYTLGHIKK